MTVQLWAKRVEVVIAAAALLLVGLVAAFPWGPLVSLGIRPLSHALGREIEVGGARRVDWFSFSPTMELSDVTIAQPGWAGPGALARIASVRVRFPLLPLVFGHFRPQSLDLRGVRLDLRRDANGRANWEGDGKRKGGRKRPSLAHLTIADGRLHLVDFKRHVVLDATLSSDPGRGLMVDGTGTHRGMPLRLGFRGAGLGDADPAAPYPVRLAIRSPLATVRAAGRLDGPLDLSGLHAARRGIGAGSDLSRRLSPGRAVPRPRASR